MRHHGGYVVLQRLSTVLRHSVASPSPAAAAGASGPAAGGGFGDRGSCWVGDRRPDDEFHQMVRHALDEEMEKYARAPEPVSATAVYEPPTEDDIGEAIDLLFKAPRLAAMEADMRARARAAALEALHELEAEARRAFLFQKHAAQMKDIEDDDEAVLLAILRVA